MEISIHALVKRATAGEREGNNMKAISIHALVKRATDGIIQAVPKILISIHALVKRATYILYASIYLIVNFNPRPREEGDFTSAMRFIRAERFQSTPS